VHRPGPRNYARHVAQALLAAVAIGIFAAHASVYGAWLIDDAGISIAYARNLIHGYGLVAQPGDAPVEGYSNPTWVALLALLEGATGPRGPWALKEVGIVLVACTYLLVIDLVRKTARHSILVGGAALVFCSVNPSFVIWCTSGLENPLYVFGIVTLAWTTIRCLTAARPRHALATCGAIAAFVAMTRPDGVLYAALPPLVLFATRRADRRVLVAYAAGFGLPFAIFLASRALIFHRVLPNTYAAKGGLHLSDAFAVTDGMPNVVAKLEEILDEAFAGIMTNVVLIAALLAGRFAARRKAFTAPLGVLCAFAFVALLDFLLLPRDRMGEHRFATPFYPLYYAAVFSVLDAAITAGRARFGRAGLAAIAGSLLVMTFPDFAGRAFRFAARPSIGLFFVKRAFADRIDRYADALGVEHGSVLLPDVGGMLLWSKLHVIDLAGLCDETVARTLFRDHDAAAAREYVFGAQRPTFIHAADMWAKAIALEADPRFSDYVPIHVYDAVEDAPAGGHASGLFVRRDALGAAGDQAVLESLRAEPHRRLGFLPPPASSPVLRWLRRARWLPETYRRTATKRD
jgi:hypothetical protein